MRGIFDIRSDYWSARLCIGSLGGNFYGPNEWVDIDDLAKLTAVLVETVNGWSGKSI